MAAKPASKGKPAARPNPLLDPGRSLSGNALQQAAQALTNAETTGPMTELAKQIAANQRQGQAAQKLTGGYYNQLGNVAKLEPGAEKGIANDLNNQLRGIGSDTQGRLGQIGLQQAQGFLQHVPQGEVQQSPGLQGLAADLARQQGLAAQDAGTFRSAGAAQGANYRGLAASNLGTYALRGQERLGDIGKATQFAAEGLNSQMAAKIAEKGALLAKNEGALRQQEIENRVTAAGLGIKSAQVQATIQNNRAQQRLAQQKIRVTIRGQNITMSNNRANQRLKQIDQQLHRRDLTEQQRHDLATERNAIRVAQIQARNHGRGRRGPLKTPTGVRALSPGEQSRQFQKLDAISSVIDSLRNAVPTAKVPHPKRQSDSQIKAYLYAHGYSKALVDAGWALKGYGYLTPKEIQELNNAGLIVGGRYRRGNAPKKPKPFRLPGGGGPLTEPGR